MLLSKSAIVKWNNGTKKYYEEKGYVYTKMKSEFEVKIEDLPLNSHAKVKVKCDYCNKEIETNYRDYTKSLNTNKYVSKYGCKKCNGQKKRETIEIKQTLGILTRKDIGYWTFKENRIKEFESFLKINGSIDRMQYLDSVLYTQICFYDKMQPSEFATHLGYNIVEVIKDYKQLEYYDDINVLINDISKIIVSLGRFPKQQEVLKELRIGNDRLLKHGGIDNIKDIMGYSKKELMDDLGYINKSVYEFIVAQYLIHFTDIKFNREQYPFSKYDDKYKNYRSDFNFSKLDDTEVHVEMWGTPQKDKSSERARLYNKKRKTKEKLYAQYNIELISLDCENFILKSIESIHLYLNQKFNKYNGDCKQKTFDLSIYNSCNSMTDEEIFSQILKYSPREGLFPKSEILFQEKRHSLYYECMKRYGSYDSFAKHFKYKTHYTQWDTNEIIKNFDYMINKYGYILKNFEMRNKINEDIRFKGFSDATKKFFKNYIDAVIYYCEYCINNNNSDGLKNEKTINYLKQIADLIPSSMNNLYRTDSSKEKAKTLVELLNDL